MTGEKKKRLEEANRSSNMLHQISLERAEKFIPKTWRDNLGFFIYQPNHLL